MLRDLFRKKSLEQVQTAPEDGHGGASGLRKVLSVKDLTLMGVAAVIGAGIFSTIGQAAFDGGPGVIFLFILTAFTCGLTALCYAEFASRVPTSGSAYTYSYVAFGEVIAWIMGWALILEYSIGNIVVAISWSSYFVNILDAVGLHLPPWLATDPTTARHIYEGLIEKGGDVTQTAYATAPMLGNWHVIMNLPAFIIIVLVTALAYIGIKESKRTANAMVILKMVILLIVIGMGVFYINTDNYTPFMPNQFTGVLKGVSAVFFAYIGFDAISTTAEECKNPQRDLPRGMLYSLLICTVIYVATSLVITGMVNYSEFDNVADPLAYVFDKIGKEKLGKIISVSAVIAATSVMLVFQIGQPRIWMSMSRDGLLPNAFGKLHRRYKTPAFATIITGLLVGIPSLFVEGSIVTDLTSIGTLFAFVLVSAGILMLPKAEEGEVPSGKFKVPYINGRIIMPLLYIGFIALFRERISEMLAAFPTWDLEAWLFGLFLVVALYAVILSAIRKLSLIPVLGAVSCCYLMVEIPGKSWVVFLLWMILGLSIYFMYGMRHSKLKGK